MSKVFKMNDSDWVYADNEEQAKNYYVNLTECNEDDLDNVKEVSLQNTMYYEVNRLPNEEKDMAHEMGWFAGELCALKTFEWVIKQENIKTPSILATTEN
jgi:hypothetical protein